MAPLVHDDIEFRRLPRSAGLYQISAYVGNHPVSGGLRVHYGSDETAHPLVIIGAPEAVQAAVEHRARSRRDLKWTWVQRDQQRGTFRAEYVPSDSDAMLQYLESRAKRPEDMPGRLSKSEQETMMRDLRKLNGGSAPWDNFPGYISVTYERIGDLPRYALVARPRVPH